MATDGVIRSATAFDAAALARLFASLGFLGFPRGAAGVSAILARGPLLVLDLGDGKLGAAAHVVLETDAAGVHGRVELFVIHTALAGAGAEERMATAVLAACEASGCIDLDVTPSPRRPPVKSGFAR